MCYGWSFAMQCFSRKLVARQPLNVLKETRLCSSSLSRLPHRRLIQLKGPDGCGFLQGLVTADVVSPTQVVQYGAFLNTQGRVLYDVMLYHMGNERVWLECCAGAVENVIRHMKKYVLRSKVTIGEVTGVDVYCNIQPVDGEKYPGELIQAPDPRSSSLGNRLLVDSGLSIGDETGEAPVEYHRHRMCSGVPEGTRELPPGQSLPFEVNLDILNGISFNKGCYIGQELTSRTYHTGVLRKRLLPLTLNHSVPVDNIPWGSKVTTSPQSGSKNVGKVIAHCTDVVLAILRLPDLKNNRECLRVTLGNDGTDAVEAIWHRPSWLDST